MLNNPLIICCRKRHEAYASAQHKHVFVLLTFCTIIDTVPHRPKGLLGDSSHEDLL